MIVKFLFDFIANILCGIIGGLQIVSLPIDLIAVLAKITVYGNAIVGIDLMIVIAGCILFWTTTRITFGIVVFIWKMLPFT